jgi:hypothetical protein
MQILDRTHQSLALAPVARRNAFGKSIAKMRWCVRGFVRMHVNSPVKAGALTTL